MLLRNKIMNWFIHLPFCNKGKKSNNKKVFDDAQICFENRLEIPRVISSFKNNLSYLYPT